MTTIPDEKLYSFSERVKGRVVLITGGANGIGRLTAIKFASFGAKVIVGDRDSSGASKVVSGIVANGGEAAVTTCDVTVWDDVVKLYEFALKEYGMVDIVVVNAGVSEIGQFHVVKLENGRPVKPNFATLNVNLIGLLHTVHLAQHYLNLKRTPDDLKAIVMLGSMASWGGIPGATMYTAAKHAILGIMRSLHPGLEEQGIQIGTIHPFFADTAIVPAHVKLFLAGIPKTPVERIAGAIFYVATNLDPGTNGSAFLLTDDGPVFQVPKEEFKMGVYEMIDKRTNALLKSRGAKGITYLVRIVRDIWSVLGKPMLGIFLSIAFIWLSKRIYTTKN